MSEAQRSALLDRAERALRNELRLFGHGYVDLGPEVQWNYEYVAQVEAPLDFAPAVDYRDYRVSGDAKIAWEPSRHQHLPLLGRAYRVTGEPRFAEKAVEQIETWIAQCPYGRGLQWRSPLELAIRVINWVVACSLIEPAGLLTAARRAQWQPVIERHVWEIARRYSRYSSANNHRIGEAAGVLIACAYFGDDRRAARRLRQSWRILQAEIERQTHPDGWQRRAGVRLSPVRDGVLPAGGLGGAAAGRDGAGRLRRATPADGAFRGRLARRWPAAALRRSR